MTECKAEDLAAVFGISATQVLALARRGIVIRGSRSRFELEKSIRRYCEHLREQASGKKTGDAPASDRSRLARAQAQAVEQRTAIKAGALVDAEAVAREWVGVCKAIRAGVLRLPRRAGARLELTQEQIAGLDDECRAVLTELGNAADG